MPHSTLAQDSPRRAGRVTVACCHRLERGRSLQSQGLLKTLVASRPSQFQPLRSLRPILPLWSGKRPRVVDSWKAVASVDLGFVQSQYIYIYVHTYTCMLYFTYYASETSNLNPTLSLDPWDPWHQVATGPIKSFCSSNSLQTSFKRFPMKFTWIFGGQWLDDDVQSWEWNMEDIYIYR